jgi:hypothetical protein
MISIDGLNFKPSLQLSKKHHYIPQYFIKGFANEGGCLYLYDKNKQRISSKEYNPKSVFFENHRNTITVNKRPESFLEDEIYSRFDNADAKLINRIRKTEDINVSQTFEDVCNLQEFFLRLVWRSKQFDPLFSVLFELAERKTTNGEPYLFKNEDEKKGMEAFERLLFPIRMAKDVFRTKAFDRIYSKFDRFSEFPIVLGDYPMLYRKVPTQAGEFLFKDAIYPIDSHMVFTINQRQDWILNPQIALQINLQIIHQSIRYVCCSSREWLEKFVDEYNRSIKNGQLEKARDLIF